MGFAILVLGVALWWGAHFFKRLMPAQRAALGDRGKGLVALAIVASIVLMVLGFRMADFVPVWSPPTWGVHLNNLLMLIAIWMMSPAGAKGRILNKVRHPMLAGFRVWAIAHLLVNGDLASVILFGGLLVWGLVEVVVINRAEPDWTPPAPGTLAKDAMFMAASVVLLAVIGYIHAWLGAWPFST